MGVVRWLDSIVGFKSTASRNNTIVRPEGAIRNPRAVCCHTGTLLSEGLPFPEVSIDCVPLPFRLPDSAEPAIMGKMQVHP